MEFTDSQKQKIEEIGKKYGLKLLLLHGSVARGQARSGSDLDIAFLPHRPLAFSQELELHGELAEIFGDSRSQELDVKSLRRADPLFLYEVAKHSQLLYGDPTAYHEFRAYAFMNFFDSRDLFNLEKVLIRKFQQHLNTAYA